MTAPRRDSFRSRSTGNPSVSGCGSMPFAVTNGIDHKSIACPARPCWDEALGKPYVSGFRPVTQGSAAADDHRVVATRFLGSRAMTIANKLIDEGELESDAYSFRVLAYPMSDPGPAMFSMAIESAGHRSPGGRWRSAPNSCRGPHKAGTWPNTICPCLSPSVCGRMPPADRLCGRPGNRGHPHRWPVSGLPPVGRSSCVPRRRSPPSTPWPRKPAWPSRPQPGPRSRAPSICAGATRSCWVGGIRIPSRTGAASALPKSARSARLMVDFFSAQDRLLHRAVSRRLQHRPGGERAGRRPADHFDVRLAQGMVVQSGFQILDGTRPVGSSPGIEPFAGGNTMSRFSDEERNHLMQGIVDDGNSASPEAQWKTVRLMQRYCNDVGVQAGRIGSGREQGPVPGFQDAGAEPPRS